MHPILKQHGTVILTFDDGRPGVYKHARKVLELETVPGTVFVIGSWVETGEGMNDWQIFHLFHDYAWDVFSHTYDHTKMTLNTPEHNDEMLSRNLEWLKGLGIDQPEFFAYPWGLYDEKVISVVKKYHSYARGVFREKRLIESWPFVEPYHISAQPFSSQDGEGLDSLQAHIANTENNKSVLFIYIHDVKETPDRLSCSPEQLTELIRYCKSVGVNMLNFSGYTNLARMGE